MDAVRQAHDPQHSLIEPHFTFVFPFNDISAETVLRHAQDVATTTPILDFRLSQVAAVRDMVSSVSRVFLLPSNGADQMQVLHDRLYSGALASKLDSTMPFVPHVTIGTFQRHEVAERVATSLEPIDIRGRLDGIHISEFDGRAVTELKKLCFTAADDR